MNGDLLWESQNDDSFPLRAVQSNVENSGWDRSSMIKVVGRIDCVLWFRITHLWR